MSKCKGNRGKFKKMKTGKGSKQNRRLEEVYDTDRKMANNDPAWYSRYSQLVKDSASFPFSIPVGAPFSLNTNESSLTNVVVPGVFALNFVPTYGVAANKNDPVNTTAIRFYSDVRKANSGSRNYEAADLMMYMLSVDSLYMFHENLRRIYGLARANTPINRYYPRTLIAMLGMDPDDVFGNLAQLRYTINLIGDKLRQISLPSNINMFKRHKWMCSTVFTDTQSMKAQTYMFVPTHFWQFSNLGSKGSELSLKSWFYKTVTTHKVNDVLPYFNTLFDAILNDDDIALMSGDIRKAFGDSNMMVAEELNEDYIVVPYFSLEVLSQIQNTMAVGVPDTLNWTVTQDPSINSGVITTNYPISYGAYDDIRASILNGKRFVTVYKDNVTPDEMMVLTRLHPAFDEVKSGDTKVINITACATEVVMYYSVAKSPMVEGDSWLERTATNTIICMNSNAVDAFSDMVCYTQFDYHPVFYVINEISENHEFTGFLTDVNNYTIIDHQELERMHEVAVISEMLVE